MKYDPWWSSRKDSRLLQAKSRAWRPASATTPRPRSGPPGSRRSTRPPRPAGTTRRAGGPGARGHGPIASELAAQPVHLAAGVPRGQAAADHAARHEGEDQAPADPQEARGRPRRRGSAASARGPSSGVGFQFAMPSRWSPRQARSLLVDQLQERGAEEDPVGGRVGDRPVDPEDGDLEDLSRPGILQLERDWGR